MRRPVPGRPAAARLHPALDRRQSFALLGSIIGLVLVALSVPQLIAFIDREAGDLLSGAVPIPSTSVEVAPPDDRSGYGGYLVDPSPTATPSPSSPGSTPPPTPTRGAVLAGLFQGDATAAPTGAPRATLTPPSVPATTPEPPSATPTPTMPTPEPSESPPPPTASPSPSALPTLPPSVAECSDGIDNDGDGWTDAGLLDLGLLLGDPQCSSRNDPSEGS